MRHTAREPADIAQLWHGKWRDNDGNELGRMTADHIKIIVDINRSHFANVPVTRVLHDGTEEQVLCISATMKHCRMHPTYNASGEPQNVPGSTTDAEANAGTQRAPRGRDAPEFPIMTAPEPVQLLEDVVRTSAASGVLHDGWMNLEWHMSLSSICTLHWGIHPRA